MRYRTGQHCPLQAGCLEATNQIQQAAQHSFIHVLQVSRRAGSSLPESAQEFLFRRTTLVRFTFSHRYRDEQHTNCILEAGGCRCYQHRRHFLARFAASEISARAAIVAIQDRICFEAFWWERRNIEFGKEVTANLLIEQNMAYAWIDDLYHVPNVTRWGSFFTIFMNDLQVAVASSSGHNMDVPRGPLVHDDPVTPDVALEGLTEQDVLVLF